MSFDIILGLALALGSLLIIGYLLLKDIREKENSKFIDDKVFEVLDVYLEEVCDKRLQKMLDVFVTRLDTFEDDVSITPLQAGNIEYGIFNNHIKDFEPDLIVEIMPECLRIFGRDDNEDWRKKTIQHVEYYVKNKGLHFSNLAMKLMLEKVMEIEKGRYA